MNKNVAIIGASDNPERYAFKAFKMLIDDGYTVIPVNPKLDEIEGVKCLKTPADINVYVDTVTIYVNPAVSSAMIDDLIELKPRRIIMNPDTENDELAKKCEENDIQVVFACTLVMLKIGQF